MSEKVQIVILCKDDQQENFVRAFLKSRKRNPFRVIKNPGGKGSGADFVIRNYPIELRERRREHVYRSLVVILDEDTLSVKRREQQLAEACQKMGVRDRDPQDRAGIFIPARNIETWLRYLEGRPVNETEDYSRDPASRRLEGGAVGRCREWWLSLKLRGCVRHIEFVSLSA